MTFVESLLALAFLVLLVGFRVLGRLEARLKAAEERLDATEGRVDNLGRWTSRDEQDYPEGVLPGTDEWSDDDEDEGDWWKRGVKP